MLAKALAKESGAAFINITAASMQSKWQATQGATACIISSQTLGRGLVFMFKLPQDHSAE